MTHQVAPDVSLLKSTFNFLVHPFVTGWENISTGIWGKEQKELKERVLLVFLGIFEMFVPIAGHIVAYAENPLLLHRRVEVIKANEIVKQEKEVEKAPEPLAEGSSNTSEPSKRKWLSTTAKVILISTIIASSAFYYLVYTGYISLPSAVTDKLDSSKKWGEEVWSNVRTHVGNGAAKAGSTFTSVKESISEGITKASSSIYDKLPSLPNLFTPSDTSTPPASSTPSVTPTLTPSVEPSKTQVPTVSQKPTPTVTLTPSPTHKVNSSPSFSSSQIFS